MSRLYDEMTEKAARLKERAAGYRFAGERRLARLAQHAGDQMQMACAAMAALASEEESTR